MPLPNRWVMQLNMLSYCSTTPKSCIHPVILGHLIYCNKIVSWIVSYASHEICTLVGIMFRGKFLCSFYAEPCMFECTINCCKGNREEAISAKVICIFIKKKCGFMVSESGKILRINVEKPIGLSSFKNFGFGNRTDCFFAAYCVVIYVLPVKSQQS